MLYEEAAPVEFQLNERVEGGGGLTECESVLGPLQLALHVRHLTAQDGRLTRDDRHVCRSHDE